MRNLSLLFCLFAVTLTAAAKTDKISSDISRDPNGVSEVIIQFKHIPGTEHAAKVIRRGGTVKTDLSVVKALHVSIGNNELADLENDPEVLFISPNRPVHSHLNNATAAVIANYAWSLGLDGSGIGVAVVDSGVHGVDDLKDSAGKNRIVYNFDSLGGGADDTYGHGTHVAGIIAGNGKDSTCSNCDILIRGIAPNVKIINLHALDKNGRVRTQALLKLSIPLFP